MLNAPITLSASQKEVLRYCYNKNGNCLDGDTAFLARHRLIAWHHSQWSLTDTGIVLLKSLD